MKTLYISDLDGTLLNENDRLSRFTADTLNRLSERGVLLTYATARSFTSSSRVTAGGRKRIPVITYNGFFIVDGTTGEKKTGQAFEAPVLEQIKCIIMQSGAVPFVYALQGQEEYVSWVAGRENDGMRRYIRSREGDKRLRAAGPQEVYGYGAPFYFTCIGEKEDLFPVYKKMKELPVTCTFQQDIYSGDTWLEVMPETVTKAHAALELKSLLGCDKIVAFGDAVNDLPLFRCADEAYAVENAVPELKREATGVIGSNREDGVAEWLLEQEGNRLKS